MPNERDIKIHGISKQRYYELKAKTRQYAEWLVAVKSNAVSASKKIKYQKNIQAVQVAVALPTELLHSIWSHCWPRFGKAFCIWVDDKDKKKQYASCWRMSTSQKSTHSRPLLTMLFYN